MNGDEHMRRPFPAAEEDCGWSVRDCSLLAILDALPVGIDIKDAATRRYLYRNPINVRLFGTGRADSADLTVHDLFPPEVARRLDAADREALARGGVGMPDQRITCNDGSERLLRSRKTVVRDRAGRPRLIVGVFEDVTEMRQAEQALLAANADLRRSMRARTEELERAGRINQMGEMAAGLAHEINQPLAAIIYTLTGAANRARDGALNNAQMLAALQAAIDQAHRSAGIVARIRDMANRHTPRHAALRLDEIVAEMTNLCVPDAARHDVRLRAESSPQLPEVQADRVQIEQVLLNLIRNGIDAVVQEGGLRREVTVGAALAERDTVEVCVEDSGTGCAPAELQRIFEPFFTTKPEGMGLGLAICQRIIEDHGGRLWAANRPEGGLCMRFTLPAGRGVPR